MTVSTNFYTKAITLRGRRRFGSTMDEIVNFERALAQASAIHHLYLASGLPSFTDNTTGSAGAAFKSLTVPPRSFDATAPEAVFSDTDIAAPGDDYAIGEIITLAGGTSTRPGQLKVNTAMLRAVSPLAFGAGYATGDNIIGAGGSQVSPPTLHVSHTQLVSSVLGAAGGSAGHSFVPTEIITLAGGTHSVAATATVDTTQVVAASVHAATGGSGGTDGTQLVTGTTGTGTKFEADVTVSGGAITAVLDIRVGGAYTVNPTLSGEPVTGGGVVGAELDLIMGVKDYHISNGGVFTVEVTNMTEASASGNGLGFALANCSFGVQAATISVAGEFTAEAATLSQQSTTGSGVGATFTATSYGVKSVTIQDVGAYSVLPSNPVAQASASGLGTGATFDLVFAAGVKGTDFNTAITDSNNALAVVAETLNDYLHTNLGLPAATYTGTVSTPDTIPVMIKTFSATDTAANAVDYVSAAACMTATRNNMATAIRMLNQLLTALGLNTFADKTGGSPSSSVLTHPNTPPFGGPGAFSNTTNTQVDVDAAAALYAPGTATTGTGAVVGSTSLNTAEANVFFANLADNVATLASVVNDVATKIAAKSLPMPIVAID